MRYLAAVFLAFLPTIAVAQTSSLERLASSLEGSEALRRAEDTRRLYDRMDRDGAATLNQQQMQAAIFQLRQQNQLLSEDLASARQTIQNQTDWLMAMRESLIQQDAKKIGDQLNAFYKRYVKSPKRIEFEVTVVKP